MSFTDDFNNMDAQSEYNRKLQDELDSLHAHRKALQEEFANIDVDDPSAHKKVREKIHELVPMACSTIAYLMEHSESDSVRANLAKFVAVEASKSLTAEKPGDVLAEMFDKLRSTDTETADEPS